jgi:hypothetical protein
VPPAAEHLQVVPVSALNRAARDAWLIRPLWSDRAVGCLAGPPKVGKTWMGLDICVSVASGTPCLGVFEVDGPGPSLVFMAEDSLPSVRGRIEALCRARQLELEKLDLFVITNPTLRLDIPQQLEALHAAVERIRPRVLLLDPLVRLHRGNENHATEIAGVLGGLREIQRAHGVAIILTHHVAKRSRADNGQALRGSGDIWAWGDSNLYLAPDDREIQLTVEHRSSAAPDPIRLELATNPGTDAPYLRRVDPSSRDHPTTLPEAVIELLRASSSSLTALALRSKLRVNNQRLHDALRSLEGLGLVVRTKSGWELSS